MAIKNLIVRRRQSKKGPVFVAIKNLVGSAPWLILAVPTARPNKLNCALEFELYTGMPLYADSNVSKKTDPALMIGSEVPLATMADTQTPAYTGPGPLDSTGAFHPTRENFKETQQWNFAYVPEHHFW